MEPAVQALLERAFHRARAAEANVEMARVREQEGGFAQATSYELVLPTERAVEHLTARVLPRLVYFLECRGSRLPHCAGVFVSIFAGDDLYFVRASDMVVELSRLSGLSLEEMVERYGR
ncbi:MAG TPA: STAUR_1299 family protein [Myxococcales bacterium]|nr:STAUR_1299 family protein [Myxococcales bacterium]